MLRSERGRILPPNLDDRTWQDLVDEMRALIPRYAPHWTDHNPSDLGMTLIELFAWLVEGLIYRLNRVPEKNYIAFLNLLGITRDPMTPAHTFLTFTAPSIVVVPKGTQAQTQGSESEAPVIFETDENLTVLNLTTVVDINLATYEYTNVSQKLIGASVTGHTVRLPANGGERQLCLGFEQATTDLVHLHWRFSRPAQSSLSVTWCYSSAGHNPPNWQPIPGAPTVDETDGLRRDGQVRVVVPGNWGAQAPTTWAMTADPLAEPAEAQRFWIGLHLTNPAVEEVEITVQALLFNMVSAHNALTIATSEELGRSNGQSLQVFALQQRPLFKRPGAEKPYDHLEVVVEVNGERWQAVDELPRQAADELPPGRASVLYRLDPVTGEISFGALDAQTRQARDTILPPAGSVIRALTYRYVAGGTSGNVRAAAVRSLRTAVPGVTGVTNLLPATGGADEEPIEETLRRAPETLKIRDRAVTAEDYEYLAREASSTAVAMVRCLEPRRFEYPDSDNTPPKWQKGDTWQFAGLDRAPGNVNVIIVPNQGLDVPRPVPDELLLRTVHEALDRRRDLTARLRVVGPPYLPVKVKLEVSIWQSAIDKGKVKDANTVEESMKAKIQQFLHPVKGGLNGQGWQVGQHVSAADLLKFLMLPEDIGYLEKIELQAGTPGYESVQEGFARPFKSSSGASVRLADYELVCAAEFEPGDVKARIVF